MLKVPMTTSQTICNDFIRNFAMCQIPRKRTMDFDSFDVSLCKGTAKLFVSLPPRFFLAVGGRTMSVCRKKGRWDASALHRCFSSARDEMGMDKTFFDTQLPKKYCSRYNKLMESVVVNALKKQRHWCLSVNWTSLNACEWVSFEH